MFSGISSWWKGPVAPASAPAAPAKSDFDATDPKQNPLNPKGLKPCCACPETKSARDDCFLKHGEEATERCKFLVQAHIACMRSYGFKV